MDLLLPLVVCVTIALPFLLYICGYLCWDKWRNRCPGSDSTKDVEAGSNNIR